MERGELWIGEASVQSMKEMGIDLCPYFLKPFLVVALSKADL